MQGKLCTNDSSGARSSLPLSHLFSSWVLCINRRHGGFIQGPSLCGNQYSLWVMDIIKLVVWFLKHMDMRIECLSKQWFDITLKAMYKICRQRKMENQYQEELTVLHRPTFWTGLKQMKWWRNTPMVHGLALLAFSLWIHPKIAFSEGWWWWWWWWGGGENPLTSYMMTCLLESLDGFQCLLTFSDHGIACSDMYWVWSFFREVVFLLEFFSLLEIHCSLPLWLFCIWVSIQVHPYLPFSLFLWESVQSSLESPFFHIFLSCHLAPHHTGWSTKHNSVGA